MDTFRAVALLLFLAGATPSSATLDDIPDAWVPSGILLDRSLPLADPTGLDGSPSSRATYASEWRQLLFQLERSGAERWAGRARAARGLDPGGIVRLGLIDVAYDRVAPTARKADGRLDVRREDVVGHHLFAVSSLRNHAYGPDVRFQPDPAWSFPDGPTPALSVDFDDGRGFRELVWGEEITVRFRREGRHHIRVRSEGRYASFRFDVRKRLAPAPDDTLDVDATIPWQGSAAGAEAFVYLAPGHTDLTQPALVVEGFDLDDSMDWEQLYLLLNKENLLEDLRADGFDAVVLNFDNATEPIQRNAMTVVEIILQVRGIVGPEVPLPLIGASMGGLCSRYALSWMEDQALDHGVATFLSFDSPHGGANIPLGIQHWLRFFRNQSSEADFLLSRLDTDAARQMLLLHHTATAGAAAGPDPLRAAWLADLAALGDWPAQPRKVGVANGSGIGTDQGFGAGAQVIRYEYDTLLADITGNVWALGDGPVTTIFDGEQWVFLILNESETISVGPTLSLDNAPGGWRNSMAEMDSVEAPYGDIEALFENHCFIPTVSALALDTADPFFDIDGDPDLAARTPFDVVYYPTTNQEHVDVSPENKVWFLDELRGVRTSVPARPALLSRLWPARPNPFNPSTTISFDWHGGGSPSLEVLDARGRRVAWLHRGPLTVGRHELVWRPRGVASGTYFLRLRGDGTSWSRPVTLLK